jgi:hypothetical protein
MPPGTALAPPPAEELKRMVTVSDVIEHKALEMLRSSR